VGGFGVGAVVGAGTVDQLRDESAVSERESESGGSAASDQSGAFGRTDGEGRDGAGGWGVGSGGERTSREGVCGCDRSARERSGVVACGGKNDGGGGIRYDGAGWIRGFSGGEPV